MNPEQKYYVKVSYEWGKEDEAGNHAPETTGNVVWEKLDYAQSVAAQAFITIPGFTKIMEEAARLGLETAGMADILEQQKQGKGKPEVPELPLT